MSFQIVQQPNGKFARFSSVVDTFTHMNMSAQEVLNECTEGPWSKVDVQQAIKDGLDAGSKAWDECIEKIKAYKKETLRRVVKIGSSRKRSMVLM
jgi:predicted lactoylglutathione lyase